MVEGLRGRWSNDYVGLNRTLRTRSDDEPPLERCAHHPTCTDTARRQEQVEGGEEDPQGLHMCVHSTDLRVHHKCHTNIETRIYYLKKIKERYTAVKQLIKLVLHIMPNSSFEK